MKITKSKALLLSFFAVAFYDLFFMLFFSIVEVSANYLNFNYDSLIENRYMLMDSISCILILPIYIYIYKYKIDKDYMKGKISILKATIMALGCGGISTIWMMMLGYLAEISPNINDMFKEFGDSWDEMLNTNYIWILLSVVVLGPIIEELIFRGILINILKKPFGKVTAVVLQAVSFGLWHRDPVQIVYTAIFGIFLGVVYLRTNKIRYPIYMHILNNLTNSLPEGPLFEDIYTATVIISLILVLPAVILVIRRGKNELYIKAQDEYINWLKVPDNI